MAIPGERKYIWMTCDDIHVEKDMAMGAYEVMYLDKDGEPVDWLYVPFSAYEAITKVLAEKDKKSGY